MENRGAVVPAERLRSVVPVDLFRSKRFVERGLRELERQKTILHVDGHGFVQKVLKARVAEHLEDLDVGFVPRNSPVDAMRFLKDNRVDLIISSSLVECQRTPGRAEGVGFLHACKQLFPGTPFVFYTAVGTIDAQHLGADAVVYKNANVSELMETVRRFIRVPRVN